MEEWKDIKGYEGLYQVSNLGNIRSLQSRWGKRVQPRIVNQHITENGYKRVGLSKNNKQKLFMVHRLVADTFMPNSNANLEINHKDYCRTNNNLNNLEWMSHEDNVKYSKSIKIKQLSLDRKMIKTWDSIVEVEKLLKIDHRQICACLKKKQKTCHGFVWEYC